jgi:hypothetical protein
MTGLSTKEMHCVLEMYMEAHGLCNVKICCNDGEVIIEINEAQFKSNPGEKYLSMRGSTSSDEASAFMFDDGRLVTRSVQKISDKRECFRALRQLIPININDSGARFECRLATVEKAIGKPTQDGRIECVEKCLKEIVQAMKAKQCKLCAMEKTLNEVIDYLNKQPWKRS